MGSPPDYKLILRMPDGRKKAYSVWLTERGCSLNISVKEKGVGWKTKEKLRVPRFKGR